MIGSGVRAMFSDSDGNLWLGAFREEVLKVGRDRDAVIPGHSAITWSGMLGKRFALRRGQSLDLQLNVENIFGQEDRLPYSASVPA